MDLESLSRQQHGVVARRQVMVEVSPRLSRHAIAWRVTSGRWQQLVPGIYLTHSGEVSWSSRAMAAVLHAGEGAALGLSAAAHVNGFLAKPPPVIDVLVPAHRRVRKIPGARFTRRRRLSVASTTPLIRTPVAETVVDLADHPLCGPLDAAAWAAEAVRLTKVTAPELAAALAERRAHRNRQALQLALGIVAEGAESVLEVGFVDRVLRAHGLPDMTCQVPDDVRTGSVRRDFVDEATGTIVECDGSIGHEGAARAADNRRDRRAAAGGRVTLRAGWVEVMFESCELASDLHGALVARGRRLAFTPCGPTCRGTGTRVA